MFLYCLLCNILLIPIIMCSNTTSDMTNKSLSNSHKEKISNGTVLPLLRLSEGGPEMPDPKTLLLALPGADSNVEKVSVKNKIFARKGAILTNGTNSEEEPLLLSSTMSTSKPSTAADNTKNISEHQNNTTTSDISVLPHKHPLVNKVSNISKELNKTVTPKKPLILNADILENMTLKSSPETLNDPTHKTVKTYLNNTNSHPGMVMPIVITILLVPMFAVLGYMALKRGQEAWKNRHYKRMDFLLDGMYND